MHELAQFLSQPLAMELTAAKSFVSTLSHASNAKEPARPDAYLIEDETGERFCATDPETGAFSLDAAMQTVGDGQKVTAVVPLWGALSMHGGEWSTSTNSFARTVTKLDANPAVSTVIAWINSPGGTVTGTDEAATALRAVRDRGQTKTISVVEPMMASAATWIGTAAGEVVITPSGQAGSVGVISLYEDWSKALENMGVNIDIERIPGKKARFTGVEPMTDEMREEVQRLNQAAFDQFVGAMAKNRGVSARNVRQNFGGGEMMSAVEARDAGLVDRVATFDEVIAGLGKPGRAKGGRRAEGTTIEVEVTSCGPETVANEPAESEETKRAAAVEAAKERLAEIA